MKWISLALLITLAACSKHAPDSAASASVPPSPPMTIAKESRAELQKAKDVNAQIEKAAIEQKKVIDESEGNK